MGFGSEDPIRFWNELWKTEAEVHEKYKNLRVFLYVQVFGLSLGDPEEVSFPF